jgi:hypothetical protein
MSIIVFRVIVTHKSEEYNVHTIIEQFSQMRYQSNKSTQI